MAKKPGTRRPRKAKSIMGKRGKAWETYEEVAAYMLQQLGKRFKLSDVEGKQPIKGKLSGTT
jgi:hypothetical protein